MSAEIEVLMSDLQKAVDHALNTDDYVEVYGAKYYAPKMLLKDWIAINTALAEAIKKPKQERMI